MKSHTLTDKQLKAMLRDVIEIYSHYRETNPHEVSLAAAISEVTAEKTPPPQLIRALEDFFGV